ncbi:patched domain-containing protein 3-like [Glandiceps talaboti]
MATSSEKESLNQKPGCLKSCSNAIVSVLEGAFHRLGRLVGRYPWSTILLSLVVAGCFGIGMLSFTEENRREKLWIPIGAKSLEHLSWIEENFSSDVRIAALIIEDGNVLTPSVLQGMLTIDQAIKSISVTGGDWETLCYKIAGKCWASSLLELWSFNETIINSLTESDILDMVNQENITSPVYYTPIDINSWLGDITYSSTGSIISAQATGMNYFLKDNRVYNPETGDDDDLVANAWEDECADLALAGHKDISSVYVFTIFSFREESGKSIQGDITFLSAGYMLIIVYIAIMLGKFTMIEHKFYIAVGGVIVIGLSILVAIGFSSACGFFYGPVHTVLPFLLLGIGVDDMFVIVQAWNNLSQQKRKYELHERVGEALRHAGVSITVTSITDFVAFGIGATTILPALRSFCVYCAIGIFFLFFFCVTFFTACLTIDQKRIDNKRNACCCCYQHGPDYQQCCNRTDIMQEFFRHVYSNFLMKLPVKIIVVIASLALVGVNIWGTINLKQEFQFEWFLPEDSYVVEYLDASDQYFPSDGFTGDVYLRDVDYYTEYDKIDDLYDELENNDYILTVDSWFEDFRVWMKNNKDSDPNMGPDNIPTTETVFYTWAVEFLSQTNEGRRHSDDVKMSGGNITYSRLNFQFITLGDSSEKIAAKESLYKLIDDIGFSSDEAAFAYADVFPNWDADKVIKEELYRNLGLAMAAVFLVTLILIANLWTALLVFLCVIVSLVDVVGMMYFWGLTIDTVTTINLILAVGLTVDYSAHIGHTFMTIVGDRNRRAKYTLGEIGPAVFNGGVSTFLAFVLLIASNSYIFKTFFKIFFLVVLFGLFHGLMVLPVLLSWIGPSPYMSAEERGTKEDDAIALETSKNGAAKTMDGYDNPIIIPRPNHVIVANGDEVLVMNSDGTQTVIESQPASRTSSPVKQTQKRKSSDIPMYGRPEIPPPDYDIPPQGQKSRRSSGSESPAKAQNSFQATADVPNVDV